MLDVLRWVIAVPFASFGACLITGNFACIAMNRKGQERRHSLIPLLGGASVAIGFLLCPVVGFAYWAWLPLVLDPGCLLLFAALAIFHLRRKWK